MRPHGPLERAEAIEASSDTGDKRRADGSPICCNEFVAKFMAVLTQQAPLLEPLVCTPHKLPVPAALCRCFIDTALLVCRTRLRLELRTNAAEVAFDLEPLPWACLIGYREVPARQRGRCRGTPGWGTTGQVGLKREVAW